MNYNQQKPKKTKEQKPVKSKGIRKLMVPLYKRFEGKSVETHLQCQICGGKYKNLETHIRRIHEISSDEYKMDYPETQYFHSEDMRIHKSEKRFNLLCNKKRKLKDQEINFIIDNYLKMKNVDMAKKLNLPHDTVQKIIKKYIPEKKSTNDRWTEAEMLFLKQNMKTMNYTDMGKRLGKSATTIAAKARSMGIKKNKPSISATFFHNGAPEPGLNNGKLWILQEERYIKREYKKHTLKELARFLGRSKESVRARMNKKMGLSPQRTQNIDFLWSNDDIAYLKKNYNQKSNKEISQNLNRHVSSIFSKACRLGLTRKCPNWTEDELGYLRKNYKKLSIKEIAEHLGRTISAVEDKLNRLNKAKKNNR